MVLIVMVGGFVLVKKHSEVAQEVVPDNYSATFPSDSFITPVNELGVVPVDENISIRVYFLNPRIKSINLCNEVVAIIRVISKTEKVATMAVNELLKGLTKEELLVGYVNSIPTGSKLNSLTIVNGEARADFNAITESGGGSCSMMARITQIEKTLLQFLTIKTVRLSIDGRTEDIFQP